MQRGSASVLKCPVCRRDVALAPGSEAEAPRARELFVRHAEKQHGVGELDGMLYFAEAIRRRGAG